MLKKISLYMGFFIIVLATNVIVLSVSERNMEEQAIQAIHGRDELTELTAESVKKINNYYEFEEYDSFEYIYSGDDLKGITYKVENWIGNEYKISFDINFDAEPTLEEIEREVKLFKEEVSLYVKYNKYYAKLDNEEDHSKLTLGISVVIFSGLIALISFVVVENIF